MTHNNYTEEDLQSWKTLLTRGIVTYLILGMETAPTTGTRHLQIYLEIATKRVGRSLQKVLPEGCVLIAAKGTAESNLVYCSKDGDPLVYGDPMQQGRRSDLQAIQERIDEGEKLSVIAKDHFGDFIRYHAGFAEYVRLTQRVEVQAEYDMTTFPDAWQNLVIDWTKSVILWGEAGIGKSHFAKTLLVKNWLFVSHMDDLREFKPEFHSGIIFDDMSFDHMPRSAQIHITDQDDDRSLHVRYATAKIPAHTKKIFTTNVHRGGIFICNDGAIERRTQIIHLEK